MKPCQPKGCKPANLIYGVEDTPPPYSLVILGVEHAALLIASLVATVFFARAIGVGPSQTEALVNVGLIAGGIASILQSTRKWGLGSGFFCLHTSSFIYFQSSVAAANAKGLSLVFGMTALAGLAEAALSRLVPRLRSLFPPEVSGLVVATVGVALAPYAVESLVGVGRGDNISDPAEILIGVTTLGLILGLNVWSKGALRLYSVLIGIIFGYVLSSLTGVLPLYHLKQIGRLPFVAMPHFEHPGFAFDVSFLIPFLIAAVCASLKLTGDIITCQKINDTEWKRVDMGSVGRGLVADGLGSVMAGLLGGTGLASSSSNVGMSSATGATSRYLGYSTGIIFLALAFLPQVASVLTLMPKPVTGAIVMYAACFMIVTGWSIVMTRMIDARKTFVVGIAFIMGMSVEMVPGLFNGIPPELKPIFGSSLALGTVTAMLLNLIFRIGISSKATLELEPGEDGGGKIYAFFEDTGSRWGARREVVYRALGAMTEFYESVVGSGLSKGKVALVVSFDEYKLTLDISYEGAELCFTEERPTADEIINDEKALARLSCFLVRQFADRVKTEEKDGQCRVQMQFEH